MFRLSPMFFICFVGLSILTAYGIHRLTATPTKQIQMASTQEGADGETSSTDKNQDTQEKEIFHFPVQQQQPDSYDQFEFSRMYSKAQSLIAEANQKLEICDCTIGIQNWQDFEYEDAARCSPERKIFDQAFAKLPPLFSTERTTKSFAEFQRACITFILNNSMGNNDSSRRENLAHCPRANSPMRAGGVKACVTKTYVNTLFNYFGDVADCLGIPQKAFLPLMYHESGLQINAFNFQAAPNGLVKIANAGLAQMNSIAIEDANYSFQSVKQEILASDKDSCKNISQSLNSLKPMSQYFDNRCQMMTPENNPLKSLFYLGLRFANDRKYRSQAIENEGIQNLFAKAGLALGMDDQEQIHQILGVLGHNMGAYSSVLLLKSYLNDVIKAKRPLTKADFDFRKPLPSEEQLEKLKSENKSGTKNGLLSFPVYAALYQQVGTPGYASFVAEKAKTLNKVFKEGVCVPESYLAL